MNAEEFESLVEGLIPEIAYSGEKGVSVSSLLKIVKDYYHGLDVEAGGAFRNDVVDPALMGSSSDVESSLSEAELASARWAWNWLKSRPQILIGGDKRWNRLSLEEVLALPEAPEPVVDIETADSTAKPAKKTTDTKKTKSKKLTERPRIYPSEDLVWQTLTRHGVDYKKVPPLEWKCLLGIASARGEGILQSHLRQLTGQDKRSLPKRTDALARKGYVAKRTVVVQKMKTSKLWLIDFAPPVLDQRESGGKLDFSQETLRKDLEPVAWRERWTGNNIDMDAFARTFVAIIKAWQIIRYSDLRSKMGINGQRWQMKTLAKNTQRLVDMGVLRYTAASFPGSRKVFKDCLKFVREPRGDEWEKFLATGKKTSQYSEPGRLQEPKPNALVIHQKSDPSQRDKRKRISPGWIPDKPLAQTTFEVIQSAGPEGASTPQISAATVGYSFRRYMASLLTKLADAKQPPHLKKFQVVSDLVRTGKTSAYMFSVARPEDGAAAQAAIDPQLEGTDADPYGFGKVSRKAFPKGEKELSLSELSRMAGKPRSRTQRKHLVLGRVGKLAQQALEKKAAKEAARSTPAQETSEEVREIVLEPATEPATEEPAAEAMHVDVQEEAPQTLEKLRGKKRPREDDEAEEHHDEAAVAEGGDAVEEASIPTQQSGGQEVQEPFERPPGVYFGAPGSLNPKKGRRPKKSLVAIMTLEKLKTSNVDSVPTTTFTAVNTQAAADKPPNPSVDAIAGESQTEELQEIVFVVRYNGMAGKLQLSRPNRALTFVRSGRGAKKPLTVNIDEIDGEPSIRDVPGSDDMSLVFITRGAGDDKPTFQYVFIFDDDVENRSKADSVLREMIKMKASPTSDEPTVQEPGPSSLQDAPEDAPQEEGQATPPKSPAGRGRGRGRGGARGRGRGRGGAAASTAAKPFTCATCGNSWKNLLGLQYHQTKAQVACNPSYVPGPPVERPRKRRKLTPPPEETPVASIASPAAEVTEVEEGGRPKRSRQAKSQKKEKVEKPVPKPRRVIRGAVRPGQDMGRGFRGFDDIDDMLEEAERRIISPPDSETQEKAAPPKESSSRTGLPSPHASDDKGIVPSPQKQRGLRESDSGIASQHANDKEVTVPHVATTINNEPAAPQEVGTRERRSSIQPSLASDLAAQWQSGSGLPTLRPESTTPRNSLSRAARSFELQNDGGEESELPLPAAEETDMDYGGHETRPFEAPSGEASRMYEEPSDNSIKPFEPMTNYDRFASEAKKKTAQAYDIVNYLLDNNCGVFPGDKSLFYALLKIFLKEFRNQVPPTFKNCNAAVKALEARKLATLHTHMLKTERGKLITCTLLLRTGIDPGSLVPGVMKQKMRESYPSIFIPAAFSPTEEELVLLESLDKKPGSGLQDDRPNRNGPKFRNRRRIEEVEVFNAPYYAQTGHDSIRDNNDPLWDTGYRSRKRRALDESATDNIAAKRQRMDSQEPTTALDDMPLDPQLLALSQGHASLPRDDSEHPGESGFAPEPKANASDSLALVDPAILDSQKETPSVFEAVKNFGLLPPKRGPRKTYNTPPTPKKLPRKLGRSRNPGLRSLPAWFFDNKVGGPPQPASINIRFLKPNTHLEDVVEDAGGSVITRRGPPITGPAATAEMDNIDPRLLPGYEASQGSTNPVKEHVLVAPEALKDSPLSGQGSWPLLNLNHFEVEHSLTMEGWWPTNKVLLAHLMPSTAEDMANRNKGTSWRTDNWTDQDWAKFWTTVQGCQTWELSDLGKAAMLSGSIAPDHKFINFSAPESKSGMKPVTLEWSDENQFAVDTLPYAELEDESDDDEDYVLPKKRRASGAAAGQRTPSKKRRTTEGQQNAGGRPGVGGRPPKFKLPAIKTSREMTPYPKTPEEFFRAPGGGDKDDDGFDWSSENTQLTAFVVFTTLLGGVDKVVDWGLMLRLYPDMSITQLRHKWTALRKDRQSTIVNLSHWFRKVFLKAYTENELPPLDFDNVLAYDWRYLVKWTVNLQSHERGVVLPKTRKLLEKEFRLSGQKYENREWREAYYHVQRSVFNRFQDATLEALAYPIDPDLPTHDSNSPIPEYDNVLAASMAWTRSLCVTPIDAYSAEDVLRRRSSLFPGLLRSELVDVIVKGVDQLQREGIISKSTAMSTNGRHWRFNHRVMETLEKVCNQSKLAQAVAFKRDLDAAFKVDPDKKKRVTYITNDGMIMALLNMQAHGRIRVETTGQPNVPMGFEPGNYETRKYTKKYLHFRLDIVRTDRYIFDEDQEMVDMRDRIRGAEPPTTPKVEEEMPEEEEQGVTPVPVPVWCDVFGRVDMERWMKYLSAVLFSIASRGAMRPEELVKKLRPTIMKFEVELILEWCKHQGLLQEQLEGVALNCSEWWWIAVDAQKERQRQMQQGQGNKGKGVERLGWVGGGGGAGAGDGGGQEEPAVHLREQTGAYPSVPVAAM